MLEHETRAVPWEHCEVAWARDRPAAERTPLPPVGAHVWYRRRDWDPPSDLVDAVVVEVQDPDDRADPNLWVQQRDVNGLPILGDIRPVPDPWPWVRLHYWPDGPAHPPRLVETREARLRGSAGWLPLDHQTRPVRLPAQVRALMRGVGGGDGTG